MEEQKFVVENFERELNVLIELCKDMGEKERLLQFGRVSAFYHKNDSMTLKASKINEIVIRHKAGYNPTTEYVMTDGNSVTESNVLMKDKALEWVELNG